MGKARNKSFIRRIFRLVFYLLLSVLLLATIILFILRSSWAEGYIVNALTTELSAQGIYLKVGKFAGPLPQSLQIQQMELADAQGVFLTLAEADLQISILPLLTGKIRITKAQFTQPALRRLPQVAPSSQEAATTSGFSLPPLRIELQNFSINDAVLPMSLLQLAPAAGALTGQAASAPSVTLQDLENPQELQAKLNESTFYFSLQAQAFLTQGELTVQGRLDARVSDLFAVNLNIPRFSTDLSNSALSLECNLHWPFAGNNHTAAIQMEVSRNESGLQLNKFDLRANGLSLAADGGFAAEQKRIAAKLLLTSSKEAGWQDLLCELGYLNKNTADALKEPLQAEITIGSAAGAANIGELAVLPEHTNQVGNSNFLLDTSRLGTWERAENHFITLLLATGLGKVEGRAVLSFSPKDLSPENLLANLKLNCPDLHPLTQDLQGELKLAVLLAASNINAGTQLVQLIADLQSPKLSTKAGTLDNFHGSAKTVLTTSAGGFIKADGRLTANADSAPGGPLAVDTHWSYLPKSGNEETADISLTVLQGFGLKLKGGLSARYAAPESNIASIQPGPAMAIWPEGLAVNGQMEAETLSFDYLADLFAFPISGKASANIHFVNEQGGQSVKAGIICPKLTLPEQGDFAINDFELKLDSNFADSSPFMALTMKSAAGKIGTVNWVSSTGKISGTPANGTFSLNLERKKTAGTAKAKKAVPASNALFSTQGAYDLAGSTITIDKLLLSPLPASFSASLQKPLSISYGQELGFQDLHMTFTPSGKLKADFSAQPANMAVKAELLAFPLAAIKEISGSDIPDGSIDASLNFTQAEGKAPRAAFKGEVRLEQDFLTEKTKKPKSRPKQQEPDMRLTASIDNSASRSALVGQADFALLKATGSTAPSPLTFRIPLLAGEPPQPDFSSPFEARLRFQSRFQDWWKLLALPDLYLSGTGSVDFLANGSLNSPKLSGKAYISQARFEDKTQGLLLSQINLEASATSEQVLSFTGSASDGQKGTLALEGKAVLTPKPEINLRGQLLHFAPLYRDDIAMTFSGLFNVKGPLAAPQISASAIIEQGELNLLSDFGSASIQTLEISTDKKKAPILTDGPRCDVTIAIPHRFFIKGKGLDSEWRGDMRIKGPLDDLAIAGELSPVRGYLEMLGKTFLFSEGAITFAGGTRINPGLNLALVHKGDIEAVVKLSGTAQKPSVSFEANPPLPQDEVLAHILFGKNISELSRFEMLQLANNMRELSGVGSSANPLTTIRKAAGLDVLRVGGSSKESNERSSALTESSTFGDKSVQADQNSSEGPALEAGKYINDSIYVGVEKGLTQENTGVRVEIELFPNITLQGKTTPNSSKAGLGWKMDY